MSITEATNPHMIARPESMAMVRIGGEDYPLISSPRCMTCQSNHRRFIENELILGRSYSNVHRQVEHLDYDIDEKMPSIESIKNHVRQGHMPAPGQIRREIIESRAESLGMSIEGDLDLTNYVAINDMVMHRGMERMAKGEIDVSTADLMVAIRNQHAFEKEAGSEGWDAEAYQESLMVFFTTVQQTIQPELFAAMVSKWRTDPILTAIAMRVSGQPQTVKGETVEEPSSD